MRYQESITETILKLLLYKTHSYKQVKELVKKYQQFQDVPDSSLRNTLSRLKNKGLVTKTSTGWSGGRLAEKYIKQTKRLPQKNYQLNNIKQKHQMIVAYDIPEKMRRERDWLRGELRILGFRQIQLSVWIGPAPLPQEFVESLNKLNIVKYLHFFQVREEDIV